MKKVLIALAICLAVIGMMAGSVPVLAKKSPPPPPPTKVGQLCMFYYGGFDSGEVTLNRIINAKPEILVTETSGGSYGTYCPVGKLTKAGIKVYSYIATGYLKEYIWDPKYPDKNTYEDIMGSSTKPGFIQAIYDEGCDGVFLDESLYDLTEEGPVDSPYDSNGDGDNSWAGKTMADPIAKAHSLGLKVMLGLGSPDFHTNLLDKVNYGDGAADYILSEEWYDGRAPMQGEIGATWPGFEDNDGADHTSQCIVINYGVGNDKKAAALTKAAWSYGFTGAFMTKSLGELPSWFEKYVTSLPRLPRLP